MTPQPRWPWFALALALLWVFAVRVPLLMNARAHLDSDLAVEGLTLADAADGHWRWHYPSATYMGIPPLLLSYPQGLVWGADPTTLASGGTVAYLAVVALTFVLGWRAFGPSVALWGLVPLAFASTGTLWLSARVYGGHLAAAAWHAAALAMLCGCVGRGGWKRAALLGFWCGLGVYVDKMMLVTVAAIVPAAALAWWSSGRSARAALTCVPVFAIALVLGYLPHAVGTRVDPFDNYNEQFEPIWSRAVLVEHARILTLECLPRLVAGHLLPGMRAETEPPPAMRNAAPSSDPSGDPLAWATTVFVLGLFAEAMLAMLRGQGRAETVAGRATRRALVLSSLGVVAGFLLNRNIFNSDNYRYLVFLLAPWSLGFGLRMDRLAKTGTGGQVAAWGLAALLALGLTVDTARYYRRFGWLAPDGRPVRQVVADPILDALNDRPEITHLFGDYWDVYRLAFLTGGRVRGVPYPGYPDRFPEIARGLPGNRPAWVVVRLNETRGVQVRRAALQQGGDEVVRSGSVALLHWPVERRRPTP